MVDQGKKRDGAAAMTVYDLISSRAEIDRKHPAITAPGRLALPYDGLLDLVELTGEKLNQVGLGREDRVGIVLPNGPEMATAFLAVASVAAAAPLNPQYRHEEFSFYLGDSNAKALITMSDSTSPALDVAAEMGIPVLRLVTLSDQPAGFFLLEAESPGSPIEGNAAQPDDVALVLHTSGTTSRPKLVPLTQSNIVSSALNIRDSLALSPEDACLNVMPLFHIHGLIGALLSSMAAGATVVCTSGFYAPEFFRWMEETRPTWYTAVPTMHQSILQRAEENGEVIAQSPLRFLRSSSSSLPPSVMEALEAAFDAPMLEAYGMTEASHQMAINPLPPGLRKPGSVGMASGPEVAIMSVDGDLLPAGTIGEIVIRGPGVTRGYENNPEANAKAFTRGWFRTGDEGKLDDEGYLFITGRIKEIINRGGEKVSPREVDEALLGHPDVVQAIAFAMPDPRLGEDVGAAVILKEGATITERKLRDFVAERLAEFKVPRRILFVDEIPKGPTGKLQRIGLAEKLGIGPSPEMPQAASEYVPPQTMVEEVLAEVWADVLGLEQIGTQDAFLDLGGDSMLATQIVARIREMIQVDVTLRDFFDAPTVAAMASIIENALLSEGGDASA